MAHAKFSGYVASYGDIDTQVIPNFRKIFCIFNRYENRSLGTFHIER